MAFSLNLPWKIFLLRHCSLIFFITSFGWCWKCWRWAKFFELLKHRGVVYKQNFIVRVRMLAYEWAMLSLKRIRSIFILILTFEIPACAIKKYLNRYFDLFILKIWKKITVIYVNFSLMVSPFLTYLSKILSIFFLNWFALILNKPSFDEPFLRNFLPFAKCFFFPYNYFHLVTK